MAKSILFLYSTVDGQTRKICERLHQVVEREGHRATLVRLADEADADVDLAPFDVIVVGASIRYGKHRPHVLRFINAHAGVLRSKPGAFFSVNVVARKPAKGTPETNPYMRKILRQMAWRPQHLAVFAGKIDYPRYDFWDRAIIRFIMWVTKGPTDARATVEFTDWQKVDTFARVIAGL